MTRVGGPKGPSGPRGAGGASGATGPKGKFAVGSSKGGGAGRVLRASFLSDVRVLAESVRDGSITEDVAFDRLVQSAISRRVVSPEAGDQTLVRSVTEIVKDDPHLAVEIRRLLADAVQK